ncbi:hypothetical protein ACWWJF_19040 [Symbiopectobacterium sp. Eva_TO]
MPEVISIFYQNGHSKTARFPIIQQSPLLHETLHSYHIVGGILVLLGVVMAQHMRTPRAEHNAVCAPDSDTSRSQIHEVEANRK